MLAGAGLWPAGAGVPNDAGIVSALLHQQLIARGVGKGPVEVTLYDRPEVHIFINIDGRFFGTSDGAGGGNPNGGAGWLDDGAPDASHSVYHAYHLLPRVLRGSTNAGHIMSFQLSGGLPLDVLVGDQVRVGYDETRAGNLVATAVGLPGASAESGVVSSISADGSSFTIASASGTQTFSTPDPSLVENLEVGDTVEVTYTSSSSVLTARSITVTAYAPPSAPGGSGDGGQP